MNYFDFLALVAGLEMQFSDMRERAMEELPKNEYDFKKEMPHSEGFSETFEKIQKLVNSLK